MTPKREQEILHKITADPGSLHDLTDNAALKQKLEAAELDAKRLEHVQSMLSLYKITRNGNMWSVIENHKAGRYPTSTGSTLREAIDAAMRGGQCHQTGADD